MKKVILKKIPSLTSKDGLLSGGFSSLSVEQIAKIKGGANGICKNTSYCSKGSHTSCTNTSTCYVEQLD
jgi:hypothetical protein